jgi:hypothetical protein
VGHRGREGQGERECEREREMKRKMGEIRVDKVSAREGRECGREEERAGGGREGYRESEC